MPEPLLLDTHVWIWILEGRSERLSGVAQRRVQLAACAGRAFVSVVSVWELGMLVRKGRVDLPEPLSRAIEASSSATGLRFVELDMETTIACDELPPAVHADPADRFLLATARQLQAHLVTCDAALLGYAEEGWLRAVDARPRGRGRSLSTS
ncbi:MAG: type II toxin-antitoxin system VapC family toxin [Gemmatimonadales bacterium]|nr:type II toxin-antitoxin system VapC family toxin [Gemmatimonadales bacterium]